MNTLDNIMAMALSWCTTVLTSYLIFWCFRLPWDLRTATGVWATTVYAGILINMWRK